MNNQLIIGVILIVVGIALALLAYAFILNRRDREKEPGGAPAPEPAVPEPAALAPARRTLAVATLMRDEVSGKLLILVGGREYATADELRASRDFARVEYAAADLVKWLGVTTVRERVAERAPMEEVKKSASMIEQINDILQRKIAEAPGASRGVRLLEGAGGVLRVFIGLQSFNLEDVPDADVKRMIRDAVAEWDSKQ